MARTERESDRRREEKRSGRLVGAAETSKERAKWRRLQRKKLEHTGPAEKERVASVPQREQLASTPEPPMPKKRNRVPDHEGGESQGEQGPHLDEREDDQSESMKSKGWTSQ